MATLSGFGSSSFPTAGSAPKTGGGLTYAGAGGSSPGGVAAGSLFGGAPQAAGFGVGPTAGNITGVNSFLGPYGTTGIPRGGGALSNYFPTPTSYGGPAGQAGYLNYLGAPQPGPAELPPYFFSQLRDNPGEGGFSASPRLLTSREIGELNALRGTSGTVAAYKTNPFRVRQQLGPLGFIADPTTYSRQQIPFIEARLNFENLLQAQADRQAAIDLMARQRDLVGQTPEQQLALQTAVRRLEQPEPFSPNELAFQTGEIRSRAGRGLESSQRALAEDLARQGVAGSASSYQQARLQQESDRQASDELARLAIENQLQRDANEASAIDRLTGITGENELRQIALNQAIQELLTAERGAFDLSALTGKERKADRGLLSRIGFF